MSNPEPAPAYLDPLHNELDRLRQENAQMRGEIEFSGRALVEQAEARVDQLTDTLKLRSDALNRAGATNDQLRATLAKIRALTIHLHTDLVYAGDIRAILDEQEPNA